jgi:hypothetical protein
MTFSKSFPRTNGKTNFPIWEEIFLNNSDEREIESKAQCKTNALMKQCIEDARLIMENMNLRDYQTDLVRMAVSLFEKRASHIVYWKEQACKDLFDSKFGNQTVS